MKHSIAIYMFVAILLSSTVLSPCFAQEKQEGWEPALPSDVDDYEDWAYRQDDKDLYLRAFGDFDGDGRQDEAYLAKNLAAGRYGVFVKLAKADAPMELDWGELKSLPRVGLHEVKPGKYTDYCARKRNRPADCVPRVKIPNEAFAVFYFEASSYTLYFKNGQWLTLWNSD